MAPNTAARLAKRLLQMYSGSDDFSFEVDTPENAAVLAEEFRSLGCSVSCATYGARINVTLQKGGSQGGGA
jgi:hypothetical protein